MSRIKPDPHRSPDAMDKFLNFIRATYNKFAIFSEIKPEDKLPLMAVKFIVRVIGILIFIALSPFILIGLFLAIAVVL